MRRNDQVCIKCQDETIVVLSRLRSALKRFDEISSKRINESDRLAIRLPILLAGLRLRMYEHLCTCQNFDTSDVASEEKYELDLDELYEA